MTQHNNTLTAAALSLGVDANILAAFLPGLQQMTQDARQREKDAATSKRGLDSVVSEYRFTVVHAAIPAPTSSLHKSIEYPAYLPHIPNPISFGDIVQT